MEALGSHTYVASQDRFHTCIETTGLNKYDIYLELRVAAAASRTLRRLACLTTASTWASVMPLPRRIARASSPRFASLASNAPSVITSLNVIAWFPVGDYACGHHLDAVALWTERGDYDG